MKIKDIFFLLALLFVLGIVFILSVGYPHSARLFPLIVISLCGIIILEELLKAIITRPATGLFESYGKKKKEMPKTEKKKPLNSIVVMAWMAGFALELWLLGFVIGLPLFIFAYVKTYDEGWRWAIILPAIMFLIVYGGFNLVLKIPLYEGFLFL